MVMWRGHSCPRLLTPPRNCRCAHALRQRNFAVTTKPTLSEFDANFLAQESHSCWSCNSPFGMLAQQFCRRCGKIQPPALIDYFPFFGLSPNLNIAVPPLEKGFYALSRKLHPDLSANADPREQQWSLEQSSV